jgi:hypothetical protein
MWITKGCEVEVGTFADEVVLDMLGSQTLELGAETLLVG